MPAMTELSIASDKKEREREQMNFAMCVFLSFSTNTHSHSPSESLGDTLIIIWEIKTTESMSALLHKVSPVGCFP